MFLHEELKKKELPELWPESCTDWNERRNEIKEILQNELFGSYPQPPEEVTFTELPGFLPNPDYCADKAIFKKIEAACRIRGKEFSFPFYAAIPKGKSNIPFFVHINFRPDVPDLYMPTEEIIDGGFAVFSFGYNDVTQDDMDFTSKLSGILCENTTERVGNAPGKIAMWAWAASRVMDYCMTLDCLDLSKAAVVGHSRLGKTAWFAGVMDERFNFAISNDSGFGGASLSRNRADREAGKRFCSVRFCCENHMQWFAPNYRKYIDNEESMPYDQHFLVAGSAPRYVYVASAQEDIWSDPDTEYLSAVAAGEVYERLGIKGLVHPDRYPVPGDSFHEGHVGYHRRSGTHYFSRTDWQQYMKFILSK